MPRLNPGMSFDELKAGFAQGGEVVLEAGTYALDSGLSLLAPYTRVVGAGPGLTKLRLRPNREPRATRRQCVLEVYTPPHGRTTIEGVEIDGQSPTLHPTTPDNWDGISITRGNHVTIRDSYVHHIARTGISTFFADVPPSQDQHNRIKVVDCEVENTGQGGVVLFGAQNSKVVRTEVNRCGGGGIVFEAKRMGRGIGSEFSQVLHCTVDKSQRPDHLYRPLQGTPQGWLIRVSQACGYAKIIGNTCLDNRDIGPGYDGLSVAVLGYDGRRHSTRTQIIGNYVRRTRGFGITYSDHCLVEGNIVDEAGGHGIGLGMDAGGTYENMIVRGNIIKNPGSVTVANGISAGTFPGRTCRVRNLLVEGNVISEDREEGKRGLWRGISFDDETGDVTFEGLVVGKNIIDGPYKPGVWLGNDRIDVDS